MKKKRTYGSGSLRAIGGGKYELRYHGKSQQVTASNGKQADRELSKWVNAVDKKEREGPAVSMNRLFDLYLADHRRHKRAETSIVEAKLTKHIRPRLGTLDATMLKSANLKQYIDERMAEGASNATINRELATVRRSFNIGIQDELIAKAPFVEELAEDNARQGFVEDDGYRVMLRELVAHAQMPWCFSYYTGVRSGELLKFEWVWMDWSRSVIVIPETVTKNHKTRIIPVYSDMIEFLKLAWQGRDPKCPYIFQRNGKRIKSIGDAVEGARKRAGLPEVLFHDLRRTAVRNMERAGIPRSVARQVSGHQTESVYIRYAIAAEKDALQVGEQMTAFHRQERKNSLERENCGVNCGAVGQDGLAVEDRLVPAKPKE